MVLIFADLRFSRLTQIQYRQRDLLALSGAELGNFSFSHKTAASSFAPLNVKTSVASHWSSRWELLP